MFIEVGIFYVVNVDDYLFVILVLFFFLQQNLQETKPQV